MSGDQTGWQSGVCGCHSPLPVQIHRQFPLPIDWTSTPFTHEFICDPFHFVLMVAFNSMVN